MNMLDFLTQDEIDEAPEDPQEAFAFLVRRAQTRIARSTATKKRGGEDDEAQYAYLNVVMSLARSYAVEPFASMRLPPYEKFDFSARKRFETELDSYLTQLLVGNSRRTRRDSITLPVPAKERLRALIHHIKVHIDVTEMPDHKRAVLHAKLAEFEAALEKERLNVLAVSRVVLEILSVSCNVLALADSQTLEKLLSNVMVTVAEAKAADDETRRLPPSAPPAILLPPPTEGPKRPKGLFRRE